MSSVSQNQVKTLPVLCSQVTSPGASGLQTTGTSVEGPAGERGGGPPPAPAAAWPGNLLEVQDLGFSPALLSQAL